MNAAEGDTTHETFNERFDAMFGEDCRNSVGRLQYIRRGKRGLGLVCSYLSSIDWADNIPLDIVEIKLQRLLAELKQLCKPEVDTIAHTRSIRRTSPTAKLTDTNNLEQPGLSFQRKAVQDCRSRQAQDAASTSEQPVAVANPEIRPTISSIIDNAERVRSGEGGNAKKRCTTKSHRDDDCEEGDNNDVSMAGKRRCSSQPSDGEDISSLLTAVKKQRTTKSTDTAEKEYIVVSDDEDEGDGDITAIPFKKTRASLGNSTEKDNEGSLVDTEVQPGDIDAPTRKDKRRDIDQFFLPAVSKSINGQTKKYCCCKVCPCEKTIVNENTTLRRHLEAYHSGAYRKWAQENKFESKLPRDVKKRKAAEGQVTRTLDHDLREKKLSKRVVKYTEEPFCRAAIEWLIATDQPMQALEHPKFQEMIGIASQATNGVKIPSRKLTRATIKQMFKDHLTGLRARLDSTTVTGKINLTCDAWQVSNTDGYFVVTGHWIEESVPTQWELKSELLGFSRLGNVHNGERLGQALYKVVNRVGIAHKIGNVTCDNAKNYSTMMLEFSMHVESAMGRKYEALKHKINCLADIINLATQALISTYSKTPYFDPKNPESHVPTSRDEVGLVRAIVVKERSSSKRKEMWKNVQSKAGVARPVQFVLDMKVRWSSTYLMLDRAERSQTHIDTFIDELLREETDSSTRDKIRALKLDGDEWQNVSTFLSLLAHADNAQQVFSSEQLSTLHLAIPALEALHRAWSSRAGRPKYARFASALDAACKKIDDFCEKTTESPAYVMAMILDPKEKMLYFKKHWPKELQDDVLKCVKEVFKERYLQLTKDVDQQKFAQLKTTKKSLPVLLRELSDDEDTVPDNNSTAPEDDCPWLQHFTMYIDTVEQVPESWPAIKWWGVNSSRYHPAWVSLARDYLSIMSSSVSSERVFSQGGVTVTELRSRLKGDIFEALQCVKCAIRHDILFREPAPSSVVEAEFNSDEDSSDDGNDVGDAGRSETAEGWDEDDIEMGIELESD